VPEERKTSKPPWTGLPVSHTDASNIDSKKPFPDRILFPKISNRKEKSSLSPVFLLRMDKQNHSLTY
jgi:hypothetical protein